MIRRRLTRPVDESAMMAFQQKARDDYMAPRFLHPKSAKILPFLRLWMTRGS
jgi:hypothetical protein